MNSNRISLVVVLALATLTAACASKPRRPPPTQMQVADVAVGRADEGRVGDYAAPELRDAHDKLNAARELDRTAQANKDSTAALHSKWLAEEAGADANLAAAKAQLSRSQEINIELQREIDRLQPASAIAPAGSGEMMPAPEMPEPPADTAAPGEAQKP